MTVHAGLGGRNAGKTRGFHRRVTVAAIDSQSRDVVLMAERGGLGTHHLSVGHIRRALKLDAGPEDKGDQEDRAKKGSAGDGIRTAMKDLHRSELPHAAE